MSNIPPFSQSANDMHKLKDMKYIGNSTNDNINNTNNDKINIKEDNAVLDRTPSKSVNNITTLNQSLTLMSEQTDAQTKCDEYLFFFVNVNAVLQLFGDLILDILGITPRRIGYLGLAFVHAAGASKTLVAFSQHKVRFLHEDLQLMILLEVCLIIGDIFASVDEECQPHNFHATKFLIARAVFIVLSVINFSILMKVILKYQLYHLTYVRKDDPIDKAYFDKISHQQTRSESRHASLNNIDPLTLPN